MPETLDDLLTRRKPTPDRPLLGLMVLVVEDSRFTCEALRMICQHSGARIRRAESLASARRHMRAYRPAVAVVDIGLPDGSGLDLIEELASADARIDAIIALSGDDTARDAALEAGADAFLAKPLASVEAFRSLVLDLLPDQIDAPLPPDKTEVVPDRLALKDDLMLAIDLMRGDGEVDYVSRFLTGLGKSVGDRELAEVAESLASKAAAKDLIPRVEARLAHLCPG